MDPFRLMILGSNAAVPANGRFTSHQVLQIHQSLFMIDLLSGVRPPATQSRHNQGAETQSGNSVCL